MDTAENEQRDPVDDDGMDDGADGLISREIETIRRHIVTQEEDLDDHDELLMISSMNLPSAPMKNGVDDFLKEAPSGDSLDDLLRLHASLSRNVEEQLSRNECMYRDNRALEEQILQIEAEKEHLHLSSEHLIKIHSLEVDLEAEDKALETLAKRVTLMEKRVISLRARHTALEAENIQRGKALILDCAQARERYHSSHLDMIRRRKEIESRRQDAKKANLRAAVELQQIQEEQAKVQVEIIATKDRHTDVTLSIAHWMENLKVLAQKKAARTRAIKRDQAKMAQQRHREPHLPAIEEFDVVKAFMNQQKKIAQVHQTYDHDS